MNSLHIPPKHEKHIIHDVLKTLDSKRPAPSKIDWFKELFLWLSIGTASYYLFRNFGSSPLLQAITPLASLGLGMYLMHAFAKAQRIFLWSVIGRYIDRSELEARLRELGP